MTEDQNINLIFAIGALVLVGSALFSRRIGLGEKVRSALAWVAIFAVFIVAFTYKDELLGVWYRVAGELTGTSQQTIVGSTLRIKQSADGHFWVNASVNGNPVLFLIDSGATTTAMNLKTARATGVEVDEDGFPSYVSTANGEVEVRRGRIQSLDLDLMATTDFPVIVAEEFGDTNVLGMNFLSAMQSWRVEGQEMVLEPPTEQ
ncbi:TIGR02281 family clan AA aspartic protease [Parasphingorhabdus sp.]|uniref:retropepsin-like aspartic protease family protein n=1 Tax=Parasphingorhabdus sp. TaxID=2709688 RepID=UPI003267D6DF